MKKYLTSYWVRTRRSTMPLDGHLVVFGGLACAGMDSFCREWEGCWAETRRRLTMDV